MGDVERFRCQNCNNYLMHELEVFDRNGFREPTKQEGFSRHVQCALCGDIWLLSQDVPKFIRKAVKQ